MFEFFHLGFRSAKITQQFNITKENINEYKAIKKSLKGKLQHCHAMHLMTNETIYSEAMKSIKTTLKSIKKVIRHGDGSYKKDSRTDEHIRKFLRDYKFLESMLIKVDMKMFPSHAETTLLKWIEKDAEEREEMEKAREEEACKPVITRIARDVYEIQI